MNNKNPNKKDKIIFLKLKKIDAEYFIQIVKDQFKHESIIDQKYKIEHKNNYILFPLIDDKEIIDKLGKKIGNLIQFELIYNKGIQNPNFKYRTLEDALRGKINPKYLNLIPKSYDIIGNIAILEFEKQDIINNNKINDFKELVTKSVIEVNKNVKSVFEKKSEIKGPYRLRDLAHLRGENKTETIHKENDCKFSLDIKTTYFSPRLVYERRRVSKSDIQENEVIVDLFAGVGPFSIQIAKLNHVYIHAFDVNPHAYRYLQTNINFNKLIGKVVAYNINCRDLLNPSNQMGKKLGGTIDRIIMNLPESSIGFIDVACFLLKKTGGIIHFYKFSEKPNPIENSIKNLEEELNIRNWEIESIINSKIVKHYSPKSELVVIDSIIKPSQ